MNIINDMKKWDT